MSEIPIHQQIKEFIRSSLRFVCTVQSAISWSLAFPHSNLSKNQSIWIYFICNGEINIDCEHHSQLTCCLFPDVKSRDFLLSNIQLVCDMGGVLWKELKSDTLINWSYFCLKILPSICFEFLAGLKCFPLGAQRPLKPLSRPRTDEHRTSLRGSGTGNAVTRGNLFDWKNI
jgi:hypothetical protein